MKTLFAVIDTRTETVYGTLFDTKKLAQEATRTINEVMKPQHQTYRTATLTFEVA